jgi:hypothetical protein
LGERGGILCGREEMGRNEDGRGERGRAVRWLGNQPGGTHTVLRPVLRLFTYKDISNYIMQ